MVWNAKPTAPRAPSLPTVPQGPTPAAVNYWQAVANAQQQASLGSVAAGYPTPDLSPEDVNYFDTAGRRANQAWGHGIAQSNLGEADQLAQHNMQIQALQQRFDEVRRRLPGTFIRRGVGQSGIAAQGLQNYNRDRTQGIGQENMRYNQQIGQNAMTRNQMSEVWKTTHDDLKAQKDARRQTILQASPTWKAS